MLLVLRVVFAILIFAGTTFFAPATFAQGSGGFNAESVCVRTHARGTAYGYPSRREAIAAAIADCKAKGGVPE